MRNLHILGSGAFLPDDLVTSRQLEQQLGIPTGWSEKHSGVRQRHHARADISAGEMGAKALMNALGHAKLEVKDIDLLISSSATYDYPIPHQGAVIKSFLPGAQSSNFPAISVDSTCTGFITAIDIASLMLQHEQFYTIAIVNSEISSRGLSGSNWETATLFGDAAVAVIVNSDNKGTSGLIKSAMRTYSEGIHHAMIKGGGNAYPFSRYPYHPETHSFEMSGISLLKMAKLLIPEFMDAFFADLDLSISEVDHILPHQASKTGLALFNSLFNFQNGQVKSNLPEYGNCISASIPLLLHEGMTSGEILPGASCLLCGTSAGFSISAALLTI